MRLAGLAVLSVAAMARPEAPRLTGLSLGLGDWITVEGGHWSEREEYGTWPSLGLYGGWDGWDADFSLPWKSSFKQSVHRERWDFGDAELGLGRSQGFFGARVFGRLPLYDWSRTNSALNETFIGGGTADLGLGASARAPAAWLPRGWEWSGSAQGNAAVTRGLAGIGSWHAMAGTVATRSFGGRWSAGAGLLALYDHWKWLPTFWDEREEDKFSLLPGLSAGLRLGRAAYFNAQGGFSAYDYHRQVRSLVAARRLDNYYANLGWYQGF